MSKSDLAAETFRSGLSCSQAVFSAFGGDLDRETALKISQAMGGGMAHLGFTCGAVTGAFLAIGLRHGRSRPEDEAAKEKTYAVMAEFARRFRTLHGENLSCPALLGCDLATPEGRREAKEKKYFDTRCAIFVREAAEILEDLLK
ncbi:MAG: C-GCAxxG-C-C family protein [Candidatus Aminicenantales bacterium]